jgi:FMN-dependent NADH-azoreductase
MKTLLQIKSSIFSDGGQSSRLADRFVAAWRNSNRDGEIIVRDLAREPVPHLDAARFAAFLAKPEERTPGQQAEVAYSDALIDELRRADTIVLGLQMYNFGLPSALKAYFDHIARAGVTFRYTDKGPVGPLAGKKATHLPRAAACTVAPHATRRRLTCAISFALSEWMTWNSSTPRALRSATRASNRASWKRTPKSTG